MATYWADYVNGSDSNDGSTYALAKKTWKAVLETAEAAGAGNIVNIVAPSSGPMVIENAGGVTLNGLAGTDYDSAPGMRIQGTDSSGNLAMAYLQFVDDTTNVTALILSTGANYIDIQGLFVDWNANSTVEVSKAFISVNSTAANGLRIRYSGCDRGPNTSGVFVNFASLSSDDFVFTHNVVINRTVQATASLLFQCDDRGQTQIENNVWVFDGQVANNTVACNFGNNHSTLTNHNFSKNTVYLTSNFSESGTWNALAATDADPFPAGTMNVPMKVQDNVYYCQPSKANMKFFSGGTAPDTDYSITIGYNHFFYASGNTWNSDMPYSGTWDPGGAGAGTNNLWANDSEQAADPFNNTAASYAWDFNGHASYTYTLEWDLRIVAAYRTKSSTGGVPGAVTNAIEAPTISASDMTINATPAAPQNENLIVTAGGTGTLDISNVVFTADAGGLLQYLGGTTFSIPTGTTASLPFKFTPTTYPTTVTGTLTITSDDAVGNDTLVLTITGTTPTYWVPGGNLPSRPVSPETPAYYISPTSGDVGDGDGGIYARIHLKKNTDIEFNYTTKVGGYSDTATNILLGQAYISTNVALTDVPGLGNLQGLNKIMLQVYDANVTVKVNFTTFLLKKGGCFIIANSTALNTFQLANADTINNARVHIFASGGVVTTTAPTGSKRTGGRQNLNA